MTRTRSEVVLEGAAGEALAGVLHLPDGAARSKAVLLCHGFKGFKDWGFFPDLAEALAAAGIAAFRFDFSHNGVGEGPLGQTFARKDLFERDRMSYRLFDLEVASAWLATHGAVDAQRVGVIGHSLGGVVALLGTRRRSYAALATLAAKDSAAFSRDEEALLEREGRLPVLNSRTGELLYLGRAALDDLRDHSDEVDVARAASGLELPWLLVHGTQDATVSPSAAATLRGFARKARVEPLLVEGADHTFGVRHPWAGSTAAWSGVRAAVVAFFRRTL